MLDGLVSIRPLTQEELRKNLIDVFSVRYSRKFNSISIDENTNSIISRTNTKCVFKSC
ncbi:hypothetical protein MARINOS108_11481 [Marinoscillum sp. 108]|nr:hypothetical protein MARINOS108_11481 [Marinoscillum sp. 108]